MRLGNNEAANFSGFRLNIGGYVELATRRAAQRNLIYFIFGLRANCFTFVNALWVFLPLRGSFDLNNTTRLTFPTKMDLSIYIQLSFLCLVNVFFTFSGVFLNTLVIFCFWKSSQLQKKLCYFMLFVLSCFDIATVITNHPLLLIYSIVWMTEEQSIAQTVCLRGLYWYIPWVFFTRTFGHEPWSISCNRLSAFSSNICNKAQTSGCFDDISSFRNNVNGDFCK